ncbi:MAG: hypothetical protein JRI23_12320 [Deltaproteobacteria bacterium]|jgi:hypothetical protein|nr:hypothetical protein [Deltaproteobacteria bacterium]MBW2532497.1 hypothetical protein [Deltaproteobacteria bacterium]
MNAARIGLWIAVGSMAAVASCTYDFDAPFERSTSTTGGTATGGGTETGTATGTASGTATGSGTTTGGTGGMAGSGGGATGGQGTGAQAGGENCANGIDDDGDQAADCADTECQVDWECAVPPSAPWEGPVAFYLGDPANTPACSAPWDGEITGGVGIDAPDAQCNPCTCDPPVVTCGRGVLWQYNFPGCGSTLGTDQLGPEGQCTTDTSPVNTDAIALEPGNPQSASCQESGGGLSSAPPWSWQEDALFCTGDLLQVGCTGGNLCAPRPTSTFRRCIYRVGSGYSCPSPYVDELEIYTDGTDSRDCGSCSCGSSGNVQCTGNLEVWENTGCSGAADVLVDTGNCADAPNLEGTFSHRFTADYTADDCTPSGGQPDGTVTEAAPYTVCCLP